MTASKQETRDSQSKSGNRRSKNPSVQSTQSNEGETMQATPHETQTHSIDSTVQATQEPAKQMTAFEAMMKARLEFEEKKTAAILQVRQLCDDWQINIKRDVYPESIKPRKPYTKRIKVEASPANTLQASQGSQTQAGDATPHGEQSKTPETATV